MNKVIQEVEIDSIMERVMKAKKFSDRLEAREEEQKFKFSKSGCEKQFKFNIKMKDIFGVDLKTGLETCFEKKLPKGVEDLVKEVEEEIDGQNVKVKVADEFGYLAVEDFNKEDLARNKDEEKKIKIFRREKKERERRTGLKGSLRGVNRVHGGMVDARNRCFNCWRLGHISRDCVKRSSGQSFKGSRR